MSAPVACLQPENARLVSQEQRPLPHSGELTWVGIFHCDGCGTTSERWRTASKRTVRFD